MTRNDAPDRDPYAAAASPWRVPARDRWLRRRRAVALAMLLAGGALAGGLGACAHAGPEANPPLPATSPPTERRSEADLAVASATGGAIGAASAAPAPEVAREFGQVHWSDDGDAVALLRGRQTLERVELWNAREWRRVGEVDAQSVEAIPGGDRFLIERQRRDGSFPPPRELSVWDGTSGERLYLLTDENRTPVDGPTCLSASGRHAVNEGRVWALDQGRIIARSDSFVCPGSECLSCALSPDGRFFAVVGPAYAAAGGRGGPIPGQLTVFAVPSGKRAARSMLPAVGWIHWPEGTTVVVETEGGVFAGSPLGKLQRFGDRAILSRDRRRLAVVPLEDPGLTVYALPGLGLVGRRTRGLFALASPTLGHWLWNPPDNQSEEEGVVESIHGEGPMPVTDVRGWTGDGRAVVIGDPVGLRALPLRPVPPGMSPRLARLPAGAKITGWFPRPSRPEGLIALESGQLVVWREDGSLLALPVAPASWNRPPE